MRAPANIRAVETEETKAIGERSFNVLNNYLLSTEEANKIIDECNKKLLSLGMPKSGLTVKR